ncbi:MAG: hypothetical protein EOO37_01960 [Cytophagaceae bacterium]|nr:MAG: hypothetical protein EOO37_01960 [Cytophagaceae bacterium]
MVPTSTPNDDYDYFDDAPTEDIPASGFGCFANLFTVAAGLLSTNYGITACVLALAAAVNHRGQASLAAVTLKASLWMALRRFAL